jgi:septin family protein
MQKTPMASMMGDSSFGVQSLEDTIGTSLSSENTLSRTVSNTSEASVEGGAEGGVLAGRKRKAGNPVHPKIVATGQRILSADHLASGTGSPMSLRSAESPMRTHRRRGSASSSVNMSQPLTPLRMSPKPESAMPSTPRSGSPKSFRLSDEEVSIASDTGSQAIQSSSGDDDDAASVDHSKGQAMPQLVMPSITMPARRPFTEKGRRMGRLKLMVVGPRDVGKTSLIQAICRACEDIVHMDPVTVDGPDKSTKRIQEIGASTRPFPNWWTDFETRRMLHQRKSIGDGVLERNILFIDTPGFHDGSHIQKALGYFRSSLSRTAAMERMNDIELISMLSGEGGVHIDAVLYLFDTTSAFVDFNSAPASDQKQLELLRYLCKWTNVIPLMAKADTVEKDELVARKNQVLEMFKALKLEPFTFIPTNKVDEETHAEKVFEPFAVSSAIGDDSETIDASILMSSTYLQPLIPSDLNLLLSHLLEPENIARLRHLSATKFLLWRQENLGNHIDLEKQLLLKSPRFEINSPAATSTGSIPDERAKVLVPHSSSGYYRSTSPSLSDSSAVSGGNVTGTTSYALARYNDTKSPTEPFRQVRLAKWAQDLQRSLDNERKRYKRMYSNPPADWVSNAGESEKASDPNQSLVPASQHRPAKGRLGGEVGIIDPRDPLGVLAFGQTFRRQGWLALQLAGSCGLIGAVAWWVMRNWAEVQEFLGLGQQGPGSVVSVTGVPAPARGAFDTCNWKGWFGRDGGGWGR